MAHWGGVVRISVDPNRKVLKTNLSRAGHGATQNSRILSTHTYCRSPGPEFRPIRGVNISNIKRTDPNRVRTAGASAHVL